MTAPIPEPIPQAIVNRGNRKMQTQSFLTPLIRLAREEGNQMEKGMMNSFFCASILVETSEGFKSKYCKNRFCLMCSAIRTAQVINKYDEKFKEITNPHWGTISRRNVDKIHISREVAALKKHVTTCAKRIRNKQAFKGISKIEITYNPISNTYHPHLHIVSDEYSANYIVDEWKRTNKGVTPKGNLTGKCKGDWWREMLKYFTKVFEKPKPKDRVFNDDGQEIWTIYPHALLNIYTAIRGKRLFEAYGIRGLKLNDNDVDFDLEMQKTKEAGEIELLRVWTWFANLNDWVNDDECLTGNSKNYELKTRYIP